MKKKIATDIHQFALFSEHCSAMLAHNKEGEHIEFDDPNLVHRITRVLRLEVGETCILFDRKQHALVRIEQIDKKKIRGVVEQVSTNQELTPAITCYVPLLKREALADALYACVELGATHVQLVKTHKVHRVYSDKELEHARACMIAAAEQSKHFSFPIVDKIVSLEEVVSQFDAMPMIFCDPTGAPLLDVLNDMKSRKLEHIGLIIGPEGDLTPTEKELLLEHNVTFCKLTPTVLRAQDALMLGLGALRSVLR